MLESPQGSEPGLAILDRVRSIHDQDVARFTDNYGVYTRITKTNKDISDLKGPDRTFDEIIADQVEREKSSL